MKILMITDVYYPRVNGVSTSIDTFTSFFLEQGHSVTLIAPEYPETHHSPLNIIRIPSSRLPFDPEDRLMSLRTIKKLAPQLKTEEFDLIHIQTPFVAHYAGLYLAKTLGLKTVTSYHTFFEAYFEKYLPWIPASWLRSTARFFSRRQCNQVDGVISPSHAMLERLREYGVNTKADIIPTGLPLENFATATDNQFREKHNIPDSSRVLLYVGRVAHEKNIDFLLSMFSQVQAQCDDAILIIAGEGPAVASLKKMAGDLQGGEQVRFIGYLDRKRELIECYQSADLFVFASQTETQGLVLLEAMACGLPVVSTASMGSKDVLKEGLGCRIAPLDETQFADIVLEVLNSPEQQMQLEHQALKYVREWSKEAKALQMLNFYLEITAEAPDLIPANPIADSSESSS